MKVAKLVNTIEDISDSEYQEALATNKKENRK
ncbi:hypothetical protein HNR48_001112 [Pseudoteredinibacter isoporae]|uniref:Uncharacterized protein n=1 Tax=Pseudoteredinibacter isoporae TaxID=570281 RepID=A0A7X0MWE1_9GAMM|nr:hypothetical protein [Pseudoteredinibacter isoporae]